jgi:DNA repair exonuclease SbcCD ATPase subunit|tara:strand:+ start:1523 stop:3235 length:1713 start_codon:yes stop_codon:yes gene_type:complete
VIIFKHVRWKNFLSTGNNFTEIQLDRSTTTLIVGENGAGKSTVLDALCFGLFNKPFRNISKKQLVNSVNTGASVVEVEFSIGTKEVKVVRGIKPNIFEVWVNGNMINQDANARDYQKHLEQQIMGLNYRSFTQVVILGSSTFVPFMQLPTKARREVVEDILDIKIFSLMNFLLKNKTKELNDETRDVAYKFEMTKEKITLQEKFINQVVNNKSEIIAESQQKVSDNDATIKTRKEDIVGLEQDKDELSYDAQERVRLEGKITKLGKTEAALQNRINSHARQIKFFKDNDECPTCEQSITDDTKQTQIATRTEKVGEITEGIQQLENLETAEKSKLDVIITNLETIRKHDVEIAKIRATITEMEKYNVKLRSDIQTYENGSISDEDKEKLAKLKGQLELVEEQRSKLTEDKFYVDVAKNLLQDSGIKTKIIKQYLPIMNKLVNTYLSSMDFFVNFNIDENFNETIKSRFRDEFSYASFSEGEKMRIDLALLFTWRAIAKMKNSTNTNLLILDEIFDSSLDGTGTDDFLKILDSFSDQNVFVISHKQDMLFDKFRSIIKFEKVQNFSRISTD